MKKEKKGNKKGHLTKEERFCIEKLLKAKKSYLEIALVLNRGKSTIGDEVKRNGGRDKYKANKAHKRAYMKQYRKKRGCNKVALDSHLAKFAEKLLNERLSPETISDRSRIQPGIKYMSPKSIRKFVDRRPGLERFLYWSRNHKKPGMKRGKGEKLSERRFIEERPIEAIYGYGHWEGDFIVSKESKWVLVVLVEIFSKTILLKRIPNRKNDLVNKAVFSLLEGYSVRSLTLDNDIAFRKHLQLEQVLKAKIYFCHPYCSWEKGLVENINMRIRKDFIPKRTDISSITDDEIQSIEDWFNNSPRQCLNGFTAYERMIQNECGLSEDLVLPLIVSYPVRIRG